MALGDAQMKVVFTADTADGVRGLKNASTSIRELEGVLKGLKEQLKDASGNDILKFNNQIKGVEDALKQARQAGLEPAVGAFGKVGKAANDAFSEVRKLAYILPGIGVAGIFGAAFAVASEAIQDFTASLTKAEDAQEKFNQLQAKAAGSVGGEIAQVKTLVGIINDETQSRETRLQAFKELQKEYPNAFSNMSSEKTNSEELKKATDNLTLALINQAKVKATIAELADIDVRKNQLAANTQASQFNLFEKGKLLVSQFVGGTTALANSIVGIRADKFGDLAREAEIAQKALTSLDEEAAKLKLNDLLGGKPTGGKIDVLEKTKSALDEIKRLENELSKPIDIPIFKQLSTALEANDPNSFLSKDFATKIALVIRNNARDGIEQSITDKEVDLLKQQFQKLKAPDLKLPIDFTLGEPKLDEVTQVESKIEKEFKNIKLKPPAIEFTPEVELSNAFYENLNKELADINKVIKEAVNQSFEALGEGLGDLLSGSGLGGFVNNLGRVLGEAFKSIGKILIQAGTEKLLIGEAIKNLKLSPELTIIAGIAAIALGQLIENTTAKKIGATAFASGGIVTGPTLGLIGEAGPEVIFPLDKLSSFMKGARTNNNTNVNGEFTIRGNDLITVLARANKNQGLV